jgi:hypothetical protein
MANLLPSFASSAHMEIWIGDYKYAYIQSLSFTDDMSVTPVGGIGSYNFHNSEPTNYMGRGTFSITQYTDKTLEILKTGSNLPANVQNSKGSNSMFKRQFFAPAYLFVSATFDIKIYSRKAGSIMGGSDSESGDLLYTLSDCRMTNYSINMTPGSLLNESLSFLCIKTIDHSSK